MTGPEIVINEMALRYTAVYRNYPTFELNISGHTEDQDVLFGWTRVDGCRKIWSALWVGYALRLVTSNKKLK